MENRPKNRMGRIYESPNRAAEQIAQRGRLFGIPVETVSLILWAGVILLVVADIILDANDVSGDTWSEMMRHFGRTHLILPWIIGIIVGHLFHPRDDARPLGGRLSSGQAYLLTFWLSLVIVLAGLIIKAAGIEMPEWGMTMMALFAIGYGIVVWPIERAADQWEW